MIFAVMCRDAPAAADLRSARLDAHRRYLDSHSHPLRILVCGPLVADDDPRKMKGSFFLVEAASRAVVEAWQAEDPLQIAGVWKTRIIEAFQKRVDNLSPAAP